MHPAHLRKAWLFAGILVLTFAHIENLKADCPPCYTDLSPLAGPGCYKYEYLECGSQCNNQMEQCDRPIGKPNALLFSDESKWRREPSGLHN